MHIRRFQKSDRDNIIEIFMKEVDSTYISHGEMQMGLSTDGYSFTEDFKEKWIDYFDRQTKDESVFTLVCYDEASELAGFIIFGIESDFAENYGILYDFFVRIKYRGTGLADKLLLEAFRTYKPYNIKDLYFESGANCHRAHAYYKRKGAKHISNVYKIENISQFLKEE